ncbi:MAG: hypothetical protein ACE5I5_19125, partial [Candidatus Heimdallarchaeota archaeon]
MELPSPFSFTVEWRRRSRPCALTEPDVAVSRHPAPIVQPPVEDPSANEQTALALDELSVPANASLYDDDPSTSCI